MKKFIYKTKGTCSAQISFELNGTTLHNVEFVFGCNGNTQGLSKLTEGMSADEVINRLSGINCNGRGTSCPDQLAKAVKAALDGTLKPETA